MPDHKHMQGTDHEVQNDLKSAQMISHPIPQDGAESAQMIPCPICPQDGAESGNGTGMGNPHGLRGGCTCRGAGEEEKGEEDRRPVHFPRDIDKLVQDTEVEYVYDTCSKPDDRYALPRRPSSLPCPKRGRTRSTPKKVKTLRNPPVSPSWTPSKLSAPHWAYRKAEECSSMIAELRMTLNEYMSQATSSDEKFAHLDPKDTSRSMCSSNDDSIQ
ncbi:hypothetical protein BU15DRAFT_80891 [Melanogaster broomeanus]|nr:hypothetical protein BU15DRAFT_80891 [Melanogaster broomeanus]